MTERVFITGAGGGIGLEFAQQYAARGARVFASTRNSVQALHGQAQQHPNLTVLKMDVDDAEDIAAAVEYVRGQGDGLDVLINNAGISPPGDEYRAFGKLTVDALLHVLRVNSLAPVMVAQAFAPLLEGGTRPRIVNITSQMGSMHWKAFGGGYAYASSKAALNSLTRALAFDLAPRGIVTIMVHPGWVQTHMGGAGARLKPRESIEAMLAIIDRLTPEDNAKFFNYDGNLHPW